MRYFIQLSYNGTPFVGWQIQPNGVSVQSELQRVFSLLLKQNIEITGCGRTDAGVHANCYYAHFDLENEIKQDLRVRLLTKINAILPKEIAVFKWVPVSDELHARFSAIDRTYKYYISYQKDPFAYQTTLRMFDTLDIEKMNQGAAILLHTEDFTSFSKLHTDVNNNLCTVTEAKWFIEDNKLVFKITANRFLRNMVRAIVGTLIQLGKHKISIEQFQQIISEKNRSKAGSSVPAHALFLENIRYPFFESYI
jgi:tRNA pseudouridine38-40 synthase